MTDVAVKVGSIVERYSRLVVGESWESNESDESRAINKGEARNDRPSKDAMKCMKTNDAPSRKRFHGTCAMKCTKTNDAPPRELFHHS